MRSGRKTDQTLKAVCDIDQSHMTAFIASQHALNSCLSAKPCTQHALQIFSTTPFFSHILCDLRCLLGTQKASRFYGLWYNCQFDHIFGASNPVSKRKGEGDLAGAALEGLSEHEKLDLCKIC